MMQRIKVLVTLVVLLLATSIQLEAQKKNRNYYSNSYVPRPVTMEEVIGNFQQYVEDIPYFNEATIQSLNDEVTAHIEKLQNWKDRDAYIEDNHLTEFVSSRRMN